MEALGFIETLGFIAAIEAADAACKSANIKLVGHQKVKAGIITVILQGDVGAVKAAVEAGTSAAERVGTVLAAHVIPRMEQNAASVLFTDLENTTKSTSAPKSQSSKSTSTSASVPSTLESDKTVNKNKN
ncbi:MAG: BMC domain-containing protein [Brevinemataceae bacterium]